MKDLRERQDHDLLYVSPTVRSQGEERALTIENTRIPKGSRRLLPTGNFAFNRFNLHATSLFVVQTMSVHSKSSAESTNDAISDNDEEKYAAMHFAANSKMFATTLICPNPARQVQNPKTAQPTSPRKKRKPLTLIAHLAFLLSFPLFSLSSSGSNGSTLSAVACNAPPASATPS